MTGLAGTVGKAPGDRGALLGRMAEALTVVSGSEVDSWVDAQAALCSVRNPAVEPDPQPALAADRRRRLFMSGECLASASDRRELARRGHAPGPAGGDAEYVLRLFKQHGEAAFRRLNGSFCLAIYDDEERSVCLVSDRMGSRPLFYGLAEDGSLAFASRVSPVLVVPGIARELDTDAVLEFCTLQKVLGWKTYHRGVNMLPPGSVLRYRGGRLSISRYWVPQYAPREGTIDSYAEELAETIKAAMRDVTRGAENPGILLGGGLDGRMMVAAAEKPLTCFCFGDYENPEFEVATEIAAARGFEMRFLRREPDHYAAMVDRAVELGSGMHPFNHAHALGFVEKIATESTVLTHGYGVEALFRGTTLPKRRRSLLGVPWDAGLDPSLTDDSLASRYYRRGYSMLGRYPRLFRAEIADRLGEHIETAARNVVAEATPHCANVFDKLLWSDVFARCRYTGYLFLLALRPYAKERSILFDNRIIDLHLRIPVELRADDRLWMKAMTLLNGRVARVINANTGCAPTTPKWLAAALAKARAERQKVPAARALGRNAVRAVLARGLSPNSWSRFDWLIRHNVPLRTLITQTLADPAALPSPIFDLGRVGELLDEHLSGRGSHRDLLFALLTFGQWHRKYSTQ